MKFRIGITDERLEIHNGLNITENLRVYSSIKEVENDFNISILQPKKLLTGYTLNDINVYIDNNGDWSKLYIYYLNGDAQISYVLSNSHNFKDTNIEKDTSLIEVYKVDNTDIYLSQNDYWKSAVWYDGNIKYELYGSIAIDEIKKMVDSIYN